MNSDRVRHTEWDLSEVLQQGIARSGEIDKPRLVSKMASKKLPASSSSSVSGLPTSINPNVVDLIQKLDQGLRTLTHKVENLVSLTTSPPPQLSDAEIVARANEIGKLHAHRLTKPLSSASTDSLGEAILSELKDQDSWSDVAARNGAMRTLIDEREVKVADKTVSAQAKTGSETKKPKEVKSKRVKFTPEENAERQRERCRVRRAKQKAEKEALASRRVMAETLADRSVNRDVASISASVPGSAAQQSKVQMDLKLEAPEPAPMPSAPSAIAPKPAASSELDHFKSLLAAQGFPTEFRLSSASEHAQGFILEVIARETGIPSAMLKMSAAQLIAAEKDVQPAIAPSIASRAGSRIGAAKARIGKIIVK